MTDRETLAYLILPADVVAESEGGRKAACWALRPSNILDLADDMDSARRAAQQAARRLGRAVCVMGVTALETVGDDSEPPAGL